MSDEAVGAAYREGFHEGSHQQAQYESGRTPRPMSRCWLDSDAKAELDESAAKRLEDHLEAATRIVASWPQWKRNCLDCQPTCEQPRKPV